MTHRVREERGILVVSFEGDVDLEYSPKARRVLLDSVKRQRDVLVDLSGVSYIDSSGVANLVEAFQLARQEGTGFALVSVNAAALRVLRLARLDKVFTIHASLEDGLDGGT
jgi:anti-sigma B factor antagonist